jgi:hypothetical protein
MPARTTTAMSIEGIFRFTSLDLERRHQRPTGCTRLFDTHGNLMAPQFAPQCTHRNKNVSARQKDLMVILPTARRCSEAGILQPLTAK